MVSAGDDVAADRDPLAPHRQDAKQPHAYLEAVITPALREQIGRNRLETHQGMGNIAEQAGQLHLFPGSFWRTTKNRGQV